MPCLGLEPGAAGWKLQTNPLSYGSTPLLLFFIIYLKISLAIGRYTLLGCTDAQLDTFN